METVPYVDLERFMGDWYVVACIPTFIERQAYGPLESYRLRSDGAIATTFTFNKGGFDGPRKIYRPTGFVLDRETNARWGMQFLWPIKADYRVIDLGPDYERTVIGRAKRDHAWVMAREPRFDERDLAAARELIAGFGYEAQRLVPMPQRAG